MRSKKGMGEIVAWVLLVGLGISLGIIVTIWAKQQAEKTTDYIVQDVERDARCADVSLKAFVADLPCIVNVSNTGYHTIAEIRARHLYGVQPFPVDLAPQQDSKVLNIQVPPSSTPVDLIPVIRSGSDLIGCADRKMIVTC